MIPFLVGLGVGLAASGLLIPVLSRAEVLDVPNARSSHAGAVIRGGGLGVLMGLLAGVVASDWKATGSGLAILATVAVLSGTGLLDDVRGMPVLPRLLVQVAAAGALAGFLAHQLRGGWVAVAAAVVGAVWLVSYTNAFNFMDGINGISSLSGAVAGLWFGYLGHRIDAPVLTAFGLALSGACLGFFPWNAPRARVFLGDVGSYGIGATIGALALYAWLDHSGLAFALAPLVVYLADTGWALISRLSRGASLQEAHREHVYQRLVDGGWSHLLTAVTVAVAAGVVCLGVANLGSVVAVSLGVLVLAGYLALPLLLRQRREVA